MLILAVEIAAGIYAAMVCLFFQLLERVGEMCF
jgi:hypothetical protein